MRIEKCYACGKEFIVKGKCDLYCEDCRERESAKDNKIIENASKENLLNLSCAVLGTASKDYTNLIKSWHKAFDNITKLNLFIKLSIFSKWWKKGFNMWAAGLEGANIQKQLNKQAFEEIADNKIEEESTKSEVKK